MINTSIDPQTGSFGENERKIPFSHEKEVARVYYYGIEFPEGTNAVSYTHLDVYKRQIQALQQIYNNL